MATSADIGANFSDYQGNAGLGNIGLGVIKIDTRPLEQLAAYTFHYKKALWEQQQKETDVKVAKLADLSNISLNDLRGKDKEQATKEFTVLLEKAAEYARKTPSTTQEKIQNELEWQTEYGKFKNNFGSGKTRAVSYYKNLNDIKDKITDATTQDEAIKQLNKTFDDTDISTPISAVPNFKMEKFDVPNPTPQKFNSIAILGNDNLDIAGEIYNPKLNAGLADAAILGISEAYPKKGTPEYDKLSENEKNQVALQETIPSEGKGWVDATEPLNQALKGYIKDGEFDANSFENDNASNTTLMNAYNALKRYDAYNKERYNQALSGFFNDKGLSIPLPPNVKAEDFKVGFVDFAKGVNANQLVQSGMYAKYAGDKFEKKLTHTGDANDLVKARLIQSGENYRKSLDIAADKYIANLPYTKQKLGAIGADGQPIDFGNLIYGINTPKQITLFTTDGKEQHNLKINNGVIIDKSGNVVNYSGDMKLDANNFDNSIITEFNKYSGTTRLAADGTVLSSPSTSKIVPDESGQFIIRMENGEIKGIKTDDGTFATVDQFQHITLTAAQKGATKYKKPDVNYGKFENTQLSNTNGMSDEEYNNFLKKNGLK